MPDTHPVANPITDQLRAIRQANGLSLAKMEELHPEFTAVAVRAWERGERAVSVIRMLEYLKIYGRTLAIVDSEETTVVRTPREIVEIMRKMANDLEAAYTIDFTGQPSTNEPDDTPKDDLVLLEGHTGTRDCCRYGCPRVKLV